MRRLLTLATTTTALLLVTATAAWACGGLIAPNGAVRLQRTATLAAYHDGVEHYVTSFEFASAEKSFGSIVPLPAVPDEVERGGEWTLQRLKREVDPPNRFLPDGAQQAAASAEGGLEVLQQTRIDGLDITILRGGGQAVTEWAKEQGFTLSSDASEVLSFYSERSPVFMAARFDAKAAQAQDLASGDGVPIHLTIPTDEPWVPLRILGMGKPADEVVKADVFVLTDGKPNLLTGGGANVEVSKLAPDTLLDDLRRDDGMGWVPQQAWLSYLEIDEPAGELVYDLAINTSGEAPSRQAAGFIPSNEALLDPAGGSLERALPGPTSSDTDPLRWVVPAGVGLLGLGALAYGAVRRRMDADLR
jgi:hypothetical protein